jgi:DNA-binding NtrC family response regulator
MSKPAVDAFLAESRTYRACQRLLSDLEQRGWQRPGSPDIVPFDARFVSAALPGHDGPASGLRRDLLAHLEVISIRIPPLREFAEDVPELLRHYVDRLVDEEGMPFRRFSVAAQNRLLNYPRRATWELGTCAARPDPRRAREIGLERSSSTRRPAGPG